MSKTLYDIGKDFAALEELLRELEGEVPEEAEAAIDDWLRENTANLQAKVDAYCAIIQEQTSLAEARKKEAERLTELAKQASNKASTLRHRLKVFLQEIGKPRLETTRFKLAVINNGGQRKLLLPAAWDYAPNAPERYHKHSITINEAKVREDLSLLDNYRKEREGLLALDYLDSDATEHAAYLAGAIAELERDLDTTTTAEQGSHLRIK